MCVHIIWVNLCIIINDCTDLYFLYAMLNYSFVFFISDMWKNYTEKGIKPACSRTVYSRVFHKENISFAQPIQDACEICLQTR